MDTKTAVKILRESDSIEVFGTYKVISSIEIELIADYIEQQSTQIKAMRNCYNCKNIVTELMPL